MTSRTRGWITSLVTLALGGLAGGTEPAEVPDPYGSFANPQMIAMGDDPHGAFADDAKVVSP
jgi:hypothetical protein